MKMKLLVGQKVKEEKQEFQRWDLMWECETDKKGSGQSPVVKFWIPQSE